MQLSSLCLEMEILQREVAAACSAATDALIINNSRLNDAAFHFKQTSLAVPLSKNMILFKN